MFGARCWAALDRFDEVLTGMMPESGKR
jgi:hypothetical protein